MHAPVPALCCKGCDGTVMILRYLASMSNLLHSEASTKDHSLAAWPSPLLGLWRWHRLTSCRCRQPVCRLSTMHPGPES